MRRANLADPRIPPGSRFANYEIVERIKAGGMGTLYKASSLEDGATVVLKVLHEHLACDTEFVHMFEHEGHLASYIQHPKVVRVHELGSEDGLPYLVMEYVAGCSLHELVSVVQGVGAAPDDEVALPGEAVVAQLARLPVGLAVWIVAEVADALNAAHEATDDNGVALNIVHRDVGPENILLSWDGEVKLTDFGIAQARTRHTMGAFKGKVRYMAPEHARGDVVDCRADVYSLGTVLWELLAGRPRFHADTDFALLRQVVNPPLVSVCDVADVSPAVEATLRNALAVDRDRRFSNAATFRSALLRAHPGSLGAALMLYLAEYHARIGDASVTSRPQTTTRTRRVGTALALTPLISDRLVDTLRMPLPSGLLPVRDRDRKITPISSQPASRATMPGRTSLVTAFVREVSEQSSSVLGHRKLFERRLAMMAMVGPALTPDLFVQRDERIAYWLNAFVALAALLLEGTSPSSTPNPRPSNPYQQMAIDGRKTTLGEVDQRLMQARDPRMYAAVMEALHADGWVETYTGEGLESRLERATRRLVNSGAFLRLDHETGCTTLRASVQPFTRWMSDRARATGVGQDWFDLLVSYAREPLRGELMLARDAPYNVVFTSDMPPLENMPPLSE